MFVTSCYFLLSVFGLSLFLFLKLEVFVRVYVIFFSLNVGVYCYLSFNTTITITKKCLVRFTVLFKFCLNFCASTMHCWYPWCNTHLSFIFPLSFSSLIDLPQKDRFIRLTQTSSVSSSEAYSLDSLEEVEICIHPSAFSVSRLKVRVGILSLCQETWSI